VRQATAQNKEEESSAIEYYFQLGPDTMTDEDGVQPALRELGLLDLMSQLISEPAFDVLRTKEQLGYR
jgi:secreted Zn-dependent insulinase-like peptidase